MYACYWMVTSAHAHKKKNAQKNQNQKPGPLISLMYSRCETHH